jgi:hypothetical protein
VIKLRSQIVVLFIVEMKLLSFNRLCLRKIVDF